MVPGAATSLLALLAFGRLGMANEAPVIRVDFEAPAGCSDAGAFQDGILTRIDRAAVTRARDAGVRLVVRLTRSRGSVHGELRMIDDHGATETRKVDGATCAEVVEVLSLTAAIAIDPSARLAARTTAEATTAPDAAPAGNASAAAGADATTAERPPGDSGNRRTPAPKVSAASAAAETAIRVEPPAGRSLVFGVAALTAVAQVLSPSLSVGVGAAARLSMRRSADEGGGAPHLAPSIGMALLYLPNDLVASPSEVATHLTAVELSACPGWGLAGQHVAAQLCAVGIGGWLSATERAVTNPQSATRSWWSVGALARAVLPLGGGFAAQVEVGATVPLAKRRFVISTPDRTVAETPAVAAQLGLGLGYGL
jgi:hypothetical protein